MADVIMNQAAAVANTGQTRDDNANSLPSCELENPEAKVATGDQTGILVVHPSKKHVVFGQNTDTSSPERTRQPEHSSGNHNTSSSTHTQNTSNSHLDTHSQPTDLSDFYTDTDTQYTDQYSHYYRGAESEITKHSVVTRAASDFSQITDMSSITAQLDLLDDLAKGKPRRTR